jgi:hypothetical protein
LSEDSHPSLENHLSHSYIDKDEDSLGCVIGSSSNKPDASGRFGCNIASDEGVKFFDVEMSFQPYKFAFKNTQLANSNRNGKDYLYMSDLTRSQEMGVNLHSTLVAEGENGTKLTNFTKGCVASEVKLSSEFTISYDPEIAEQNSSEEFTINTTNNSSVKLQNIMRINDNNNSQLAEFNNFTLVKDSFLDEDEGNITVDILYNLQRYFNDTTNPIKVNFLSLDANATTTKAKIANKDTIAKGKGAINNGSRVFYYARVASLIKNFPETNKRVIKTPLYVEIYCKVLGNRNWCDTTMNLKNISRNSYKTDNGWYLAIEHNSTVDGKINRLVSDNTDVRLRNILPIPDFVDGRVDTIETIYIAEKIEGTNKAEIAIDSDIWLRFNTKNITGMPQGTSSYSVKFKDISNETGVGKRGYMLKQRPQIDRNGKMSW